MANGGKASDSPNILLILNDDMGFSDIGCYGGEIETPNLDRLAAKGLRYSQFYNTARCSPSRASLLTGLHPHQTGIGILTYSNGPEGYAGNLNRSCVTIAEVLKQNKYTTYLTGKWHIASNLTEPTDAWPMQRGFDHFYGTIIGAGSFYNPNTLTRGNDNIEHEAENDPSFFYTDAISDQAAAYIRGHKAENPDKPFFQYVAYTAPHWPLHAHDEDIAKYKGRFDAGWDRLREQRLQRLVDDGIIHPNWQLTDRDPTQPPWTEAAAPRMDAALHGGLCGADRPHGPGHRPHYRGTGRDRPDGQHADHLPVRQRRLRRGHSGRRDGARAGRSTDDREGQDAQGRARTVRQRSHADARRRTHLSELRHRVGQSVEHAVPALQALDPRRRHSYALHRALAARNQGTRRPASQSEPAAGRDGDHPRRDGRDLSEGIQRQRHPALEGESLVPSFSAAYGGRGPLFWEHEGNAAVRIGKWKLVRKYPEAWELYDMELDRTEMHDLAAEHPERVRDMVEQYQRWANRCGVIPREKILALMEAQGETAFWEEEKQK